MLLDKQNEFSDSQAVTVSAISTNVVDTLPSTLTTGVLVSNLGGDSGGYLVVQTDAAFTGMTSVTISLESSSTANLATTPTVHFASGAFLPADMTAGKTLLSIPLPFGDYKKYLGVRYTVVGTASTGTISAFISAKPQTWKSYKAAARPD